MLVAVQAIYLEGCSPLQQARTQDDTAMGKPLALQTSRFATICSFDIWSTEGDTEGAVSGVDDGSGDAGPMACEMIGSLSS